MKSAPQAARRTSSFAALRSLVPYVVRTRAHASAFKAPRLPFPLRPLRAFDPGDLDARVFLERLESLDGRVYGPRGLALPRWALYDTVEVPGAIVGLASPSSALSLVARAALAIDADDDTLVPLSACMLVPTLSRSTFWCSALESINQIAPGAGPPSLRRVSLALALRGFRAKTLVFATQWRASGLSLYTHLGSLDLLAAFTPAHTHPATAVLRAHSEDGRWPRLLARTSTRTKGHGRSIDVDDYAALADVQRALERGARITLTEPPRVEDARVLATLHFRGAAR